MGCGGSQSADAKGGRPSHQSEKHLEVQHERLRKLQELDGATKIPFIMVELRGHGHKEGFIEICGKDEYGVYAHLEEWLVSTWQCKKLDAGSLSDDTPLPFCDAVYSWDGFMQGSEAGTNNMGLATMRLVTYMTRELTWTLGIVNGGNVGLHGEIREQQIIFKAPHPMNMKTHHLMLELRSAGAIEVCGDDRNAKDALHGYLGEKMAASAVPGHQVFSDRYYTCGENVFKERDGGENNLGLLTVDVCDMVVQRLPGYSLVCINGGNYGEGGCHREQQMVFRKDDHPLAEEPHLLVELRAAGFVEVCGKDVSHIHRKLTKWLKEAWGCELVSDDEEAFCAMKFSWEYKDMLVASAELTGFFHGLGWMMQVCSQGTVEVEGDTHSREQQIIFRPGASSSGNVEPHLFIELYTGEGDEKLMNQPEVTAVHQNQHIRICAVGDAASGLESFSEFLVDYMGGKLSPSQTEDEQVKTFIVDVFLSRGLSDNNLGCWTMRVCDFMVDRLGWSFVVCNVCNLGTYGNHREQQLVFRYDGARREIPPVTLDLEPLDEMRYVGLKFPSYWNMPKVLDLQQTVGIESCQAEEIHAMQEIFDNTFRRVLTRDRVYEFQLKVDEEMPYRLDIVTMFRCEHAELYRGFAERRQAYRGGQQADPKTMNGGALLNNRLGEGEALLFHGTNPSSAMGILKTGFKLSAAGKSTGTMFGYGIYLAECCSKSDEYGRDDNGGTFPGLMAMLVCRALVGKPYLVTDPGDYCQQARDNNCDCVLGDRESKVGTYREFIFFDERSVVPEYAVIYKRQYAKTQVPENMRTCTRGTTGKNWCVQLDRGWASIAPNVSYMLGKTQREGKTTMTAMISEVNFLFDLNAMTQTNQDTGAVRNIREPMRK